MPARRRAFTGRRIFVTLAAAAGVALTQLPASASPAEPSSPAEATALIAARSHDLEVVSEQINDARLALTAKQDAAQQAAAQVAEADTAVAAARDQVRVVARSAYTGDKLSTLQAVLTSSSADQMLDRVGTLDSIAQHNDSLLGAAQQATDTATQAKADADRATADAQAQVDSIATQQTDLQKQVAAYQADFSRLTAEQQAAAQAAADMQQASASTADSDIRSAPAATRSTREAVAAPAAPAAVVAASSSSGQSAVSTAMAQVGKPYVWGAAGPGSFDCSGLTQYAYAAAGVSLPHSSSAQSGMGRAVSRADLQPGDLIFFYSPVSHVGIYIGNGQMVHASTSGQPVKVASVDSMGNYNSARRLVG
jgi:cell wall-associated NlpC family hydrolase